MKTFKVILLVVGSSVLLIGTLFSCNVMWKSPSFYKVQQNTELKESIMDMKAYEQIRSSHRRPYCYSINSISGGKVYILGVEHMKDENHGQFDTIRNKWIEASPTVALVEGRLGFLFTWFQDPIKKYGEGGLVSQLAKKDKVKLFTWEPTKHDEIEILMRKFSVEKIAMFYAFRPYFNNMRHGKPENPEEKLQSYLKSRTDYEHIKDVFQSWEELDSIWRRDFPNIDWRNYSDEKGWPEGYLYDLWNASNLARDFHLVQIILELVQKGETVFVTMGSSHAPRIEKSLIETIQ